VSVAFFSGGRNFERSAAFFRRSSLIRVSITRDTA
jgi:hypothetical protein